RARAQGARSSCHLALACDRDHSRGCLVSRVRHRKRKEEKLSAPAEAYRAFRTEQARYSSAMRAFIDRLSFAPDDYQIEAMSALDAGANVLVAAPTGAGKTLVADYAIAQVAAQGGKLFYTTPIKALSNQ